MILAPIVAEIPAGLPSEYYPWFAVGGVFICIVALVMGANAIDDFLERRKTKPGHPANESLNATQQDLTRRIGVVEGDVNVLHAKIGSSERETRRQLDEKTTKLSSEITTVSMQVAGIAATNETQSQQLAVINSDIKKILVSLPRRNGGTHD
jgi:septal ring factor EnvC (AmiA/AmiB activator)